MKFSILVLLALGQILGISRGDPIDGQVRLNNRGSTDTNAGIVQVYYNGVWGTGCAGEYWNSDAAAVVCRQLGFAGSMGITNPDNYYSGGYFQTVWDHSDLYCMGTEVAIADCVEGQPEAAYNCPLNQDLAAVICADVRLVDTEPDTEGYSGRVEFYDSGNSYGICGRVWTDEEAKVVCNMLFPWDSSPSESKAKKIPYTSTDKAVPFVRCREGADTLHDCQFDVDNLRTCPTRAGVSCVEENQMPGDFNPRALQLLRELLHMNKE